jgi:D-tyrosyl-tRNA(Tyr) deacylase
MIGLLQRVTQSKVSVNQNTIGQIGRGVLLLLGVEKNDSPQEVDRLVERVLTFRLFEDSAGKMNRSLLDTQGELLVVSQFTLAADTQSGTRAGFSTAAEPVLAKQLVDRFVKQARLQLPVVQTGQFGAHMQVELINDGPVTFHLRVAPKA